MTSDSLHKCINNVLGAIFHYIEYIVIIVSYFFKYNYEEGLN